MIQQLSRDDVIDILVGATLYGGGGGGDLDEGLALIDRAAAAGKTFRMAALDDMPNDALICTPYLLGAISDLPEGDDALIDGKTPPILAAYQRLADHLGQPIQGAVPCELGGSNTAVPFYLAAMADSVVVDADPTGRAVPEITHSAYALNDLPVGTIVTANLLGETTVIDGIATDARAEEIVRALAQLSGNDIAAIDHTLPASVLGSGLLTGTLSQGRKIGRLLRAGHADPAELPAEIAKAADGRVLFEGIVAESYTQVADGFTVGHFEVTGAAAFADQRFRVDLKNENMVGRLNGVPVVTIPEIISVLDMDTGDVITNPHVRPEQKVAILVLPAPAVFLTQRGLDTFGPQYAGIMTAFRSALPNP